MGMGTYDKTFDYAYFALNNLGVRVKHFDTM